MNTQYGTQYEYYVLKFLQNTKKFKFCYMWKDVPKEILLELGFIDDLNENCIDLGCDILCKKHDENFVFIQCKNYSTTGIDNVITSNNMGLFFVLAYQYNFEAYVYYTGKISKNLLRINKKRIFINLPYVTAKDENINIQNKLDIIPRDYQINAYNMLKNIHRGILQMPCGTGKTFVTQLLSLDYDNIILLSPLICTTEQLLRHYRNYYNYESNIKYHEIDCSVGRSINIDYDKKNIIAATYKSCDIINKILPKLKNVLIVIDEFHNLSKTNLNNKDDDINKLLESNINIVFVSATPKILLADDKYEKYFGTVKYELEWSEAIANKYICNICNVYPNKQEIQTSTQELFKLSPKLNELIGDNNNLDKINQVLFILSGLKRDNNKKCIQYFKSREQITKYIPIIQIISALMNLDISIHIIDCDTKKSNRKTILDTFCSANNIQIICNVYILNEGIDIPSCDSIFLIDPRYDPKNMIQRMNRCNRLDINRPGKIGYVYLWSDEDITIDELYQDLVKYLPNKMKETHNNDAVNENVNKNLKAQTAIPNKIINEYYEFYEMCKNDVYGIEVSLLIKYLNLKNSKKFHERLRTEYVLNIDYVIKKTNKRSEKGIPNVYYYISFECFKKICMMSKTKQGNNMRNYFLTFHKFID